MSLVPRLPWEVTPARTSTPNISPTRYTVKEPEDSLVVRLPNCPTPKEAANTADQLANGQLYDGSYPNRRVGLHVEAQHLDLLHYTIAENTKAISYLWHFGHQELARNLNKHLELLLYLHDHDTSIVDNLDPYICTRVTEETQHLQDQLQNLNDRLNKMENPVDGFGNPIKICDWHCLCKELGQQYDTILKQITQLSRPPPPVIYKPNKGIIAAFLQVYEKAMDGASDSTKARHILGCLNCESQKILAFNLQPGLTWEKTCGILIAEFGSAKDVHNMKTKFMLLKLGKRP